ncbi:uncharacterized protein PHALS_11693 [Plasmopara halstedii]|uniref:Uncharacterized protein n=1 Tax=Plasmopara halstedii TaxID=4781 RepID=A0A0P1AKB1_PLAHL|nr:uncharacterized protein PHALS_11693 [Plasmopara halstedii]CEG41342.1 hypothetical protein PHALS_11693 [Plasmopara halstedii]|eukprot:XP_024577711.1 hypothetical protein PHALS_11693 [Plasmopara halstedii]
MVLGCDKRIGLQSCASFGTNGHDSIYCSVDSRRKFPFGSNQEAICNELIHCRVQGTSMSCLCVSAYRRITSINVLSDEILTLEMIVVNGERKAA